MAKELPRINAIDRGVISQLEASVLSKAKHKGRFFDFNQRSIVNYEHTSLFIKYITERGLQKTIALFNKGIGIDEKFGRLTEKLQQIDQTSC